MTRPGVSNPTPPTDGPTGPWADDPPATPSPTLPTRVRPTGAVPKVLAAGDRVAQYQVLKPLGEGGMGVVFKGWDVNLRRPVALKVLRPEVATDPTARSRFVREARAAAAVQHDHVVTIHQVGEANGVVFIAMQYLHGTPLDRVLAARRSAPLDPTRVVRIGREVADGLGAAHRLGLVHRDVKPSNVWLEAPKGRVKLLDFGIAKLNHPAGGGRGLTEPGIVMGTPAYMSPEQARGHGTDPRADLFSLGAVLYELCTGATPFARGTVMETLTALVDEAPPPVRDRNPAVPPGLADLIERLLAKDPAARPQTADEVVAELRRVERDMAARRETLAAPSGSDDLGYEVVEDAPPPRRRARRGRGKKASRGLLVPAVAGGVALAACVAVVVVLGLNRGGGGPEHAPTPATGIGTDDRGSQWEAARPDWMNPGSPPPPWWEPGVRMPADPPPGWREGHPIPPPPELKGKHPPPKGGRHREPPSSAP